MFTLASTEIMSWVGAFIWPLIRVSAMIGAAPIFGALTIPVRVKLVLSVVITLIILPLLPPLPQVDPLSGTAFLITLNQILIGAAMGLAMQLFFAIFVVGGQIIAFQMGLGFASMIDPNSGTQVPVLSQFYVIFLTLVFLALDGHLVMIEVIVDSFRTMPVAAHGMSADNISTLIAWSSVMYSGAVQIALPAIASLLLINLTFGVVTRSAPQFNIFSVGFPVTILAGFFIMLVTLPAMIPQIEQKLFATFELMKKLVISLI